MQISGTTPISSKSNTFSRKRFSLEIKLSFKWLIISNILFFYRRMKYELLVGCPTRDFYRFGLTETHIYLYYTYHSNAGNIPHRYFVFVVIITGNVQRFIFGIKGLDMKFYYFLPSICSGS